MHTHQHHTRAHTHTYTHTHTHTHTHTCTHTNTTRAHTHTHNRILTSKEHAQQTDCKHAQTYDHIPRSTVLCDQNHPIPTQCRCVHVKDTPVAPTRWTGFCGGCLNVYVKLVKATGYGVSVGQSHHWQNVLTLNSKTIAPMRVHGTYMVVTSAM